MCLNSYLANPTKMYLPSIPINFGSSLSNKHLCFMKYLLLLILPSLHLMASHVTNQPSNILPALSISYLHLHLSGSSAALVDIIAQLTRPTVIVQHFLVNSLLSYLHFIFRILVGIPSDALLFQLLFLLHHLFPTSCALNNSLYLVEIVY